MDKKWCAKCGDSYFATIVEGEDTFHFCKECMDIINKLDRTNNVVHDFLDKDKKESQVTKNMREAQERRAKGVSLWQ